MAGDVLSEVIKVEKEIQEKIRDEERRCRDAIARAQKDAEDEVAQEEQRLKAALSASSAEALKDALKKADEIRASARLFALCVESISDEQLRGLLTAPLLSIVPRRHYDSQDVKD